MIILPIKHITEVDQEIFGVCLLNLARLARLDFPVAPGVGISAPEIVLKTVLRHWQEGGKEIFEQRLSIIKQALNQIEEPEVFKKELGGRNNYYWGKALIRGRLNLWKSLLQFWLEEIRARIWREGFNSSLTRQLSTQAVFFVEEKKTSGLAFFDPTVNEVLIECSERLKPQILKQIDQLVLDANKKLLIPQNYSFILKAETLFLTGLSPFTQTRPVSDIPEILLPKKQIKQLVKSAVKIFINLSTGFAIEGYADGVLIEGQQQDLDQTIFKLAESALAFYGKPVIFTLPESAEGKLHGAVGLIHQKNLLDQAAQAFLFCRNKKNLLNLELALPLTRSVEELVQLKRELAAHEISRKGTLKFWWEVALPENIINLSQYLETGLDGVILNLDSLQLCLLGFGTIEAVDEELVSFNYKKQILSLIKFIEPIFKVLHQEKVPILAKGVSVLHPEVLNFLVEKGVYGVVANTLLEAGFLPEHLSWVEERVVAKRLV